MPDNDLGSHVTSEGHVLSSDEHLDRHYIYAQPEYEAILKSVGLQQGWHVLDAGCGGGSFLPLMSELVGSDGHISAMDIAPENVEAVNKRKERGDFLCPVEARVGSVVELPYEANFFDALWCANVTQYLTDSEFETALQEFIRVVKPGGLIAIKDWDSTVNQMQPADPFWSARIIEAGRKVDPYSHQLTRSITLPQWFRRAGLEHVWLKTFLTEKQAPLNENDSIMLQGVWPYVFQSYMSLDLSDEDMLLVQKLANVDILTHPDFYTREGHVIAVGVVPGSGR